MKIFSTIFEHTKLSKIFLFLSLVTAVFILICKTTNVYKFALGGAVYEILWLPAIICLFTIPLISLWLLLKQKFSFKSYYLYSAVICVIALLLLRN